MSQDAGGESRKLANVPDHMKITSQGGDSKEENTILAMLYAMEKNPWKD